MNFVLFAEKWKKMKFNQRFQFCNRSFFFPSFLLLCLRIQFFANVHSFDGNGNFIILVADNGRVKIDFARVRKERKKSLAFRLKSRSPFRIHIGQNEREREKTHEFFFFYISRQE